MLGENLLSKKIKAQKIEASVEQQLSQNNIASYFAAVKLQARI